MITIEERKKIGEIIRVARKKANMSQTALANKLEVSPQAVYSYEVGNIKIIPFGKRLLISRILDIDIEKLYYSTEKSKKFIQVKDTIAANEIKANELKSFLEKYYSKNNTNLFLQLANEELKKDFNVSIDKEDDLYNSYALVKTLKMADFLVEHINMFDNSTSDNMLLKLFFQIYYPPLVPILEKINIPSNKMADYIFYHYPEIEEISTGFRRCKLTNKEE